MKNSSSLSRRMGLLAINALILLTLSGCTASHYVSKCFGIRTYEGFNEPRRVLIDKKSGTVVIDADAFYFKPKERKIFYTGHVVPEPRSALSPRPIFRRFIVTDAINMEKLVQDDLESGKKWSYRQGEPPDELEVYVYMHPAGLLEPWRVVPKDFDAPSATDDQLAALLPGGYTEYPWRERIPMIADDGKTYKVKFHTMDDRYHRSLPARVLVPILYPAANIIDVATFPIQLVAFFVITAIQ